MLGLVAGGAYYIGVKNNPSVQLNSTTNTQPAYTQTTLTSSPSPAKSTNENTTWKTETVQIKKETAVSGSETINLLVQIPSDWKLQTVARSSNTNNLIKNCADYVITSSDSTAKLTFSPICAGWGASYSTWPQDAVVVKEEKNVGNDGHTAYTVRYFDSQKSQYNYVEGEKSTNQIQDAVLIRYNPSQGNFIPSNIMFTYSGTDKKALLKISDQIVSSIKAQ